jgi:hypothetical protein
MADFSVSDVASRVNPPQQISIGDMLNIARGAQAYKQAEQINPLLLQEQRAILQQQEIAAQKASRVLEPDVAAKIAESKKSVLSAEQAGVDLKQHYSNVGRGLFGGFITDPDFVNGNSEVMIKKIEGAKDYAKNVLGVPDDVLSNADRIVEMAKSNPKQAYQYIKNGVLQSGQNAAQTAMVTPRLEVINGVPQQITPASGEVTPLQTQVPYQQTVTDLTGRTSIQNRSPRGEYIGTSEYPTKPMAQPGQPGQQSEFLNIPVGETKESLAVITGQRNEINKAARQVPIQQFNANQIIKLADITDTGVGAETLRNLGGGYAALPWTNNNATNYDKLGHYIAANSISLAQQAGLSTDAGRSLQEQASGSTRFTKESLKSVARTNRALASGVDLLNRGIENSIQSTGNPFAARDFQNQWSQTVDVNALRLYDGLKNNDQQVIRDVVKELGGIKSKEYKTLLQRMDRMKQLIQGQR